MRYTPGRVSGFRRYRNSLVLGALLLASGFWWLFRPERLFINQQVNETASAWVTAPQPIFTGSLQSAAGANQTDGRVNIVKNGGRLQLQIDNFESKASKSFGVALAPRMDSMAGAQTLGDITIGGHEKLTLPSGIDPAIDKSVLLTNASNRIVATATLEPF